MNRLTRTAATRLARAWAVDRPLTIVTLAMLPVLAASVAGLSLDPRIITGAPAWLKPAKFAASIAIFGATMIWVFSYLEGWPRLRRRVSLISSAVFIIEMAIISLQAWRGTTSHFNTATVFDGVLFGIMGSGILLQTATTVAVAVALWRQPFADRALGWALRLGIVISIAGSLTGGLMTRPTDAQLASARMTGQLPISGGHTVGAPDGGPGLPGTGWSTSHGDVRVPHFVGLHALQLVPAILLLAPAARRRTQIVVVTAASYAAFFGLLLWQALMGESVLHPSGPTTMALAIWGIASVVAFALTNVSISGHRDTRAVTV